MTYSFFELALFTVLFYGRLCKECKTVKTWNRTRIQGLLRHKSGRYYARMFTRGKEKWVSLGMNLFEIAKARMGT